VIDIYKKTLEAEFPISAKNPLLGAMTPDARLAITGFNEGSDAGEVVLWDLANKKYLGKLIEAAVVDFNFSADGNKVIVLSQDGKTGPYNVAVFDTQTLAKIHEHNFYPSDFVTHCRLNSHGTQAVLELGQNEMLVWDLALDQVGPRFNGRAANHTASHYIGFSNTETPTGTRHQLELYKLGENDPIASYTNDLGMSGNVAVSAHGSHVVMKYGEKTQIFELSEDDEL
jgi:WD40 repeat protein